MQIYSGLDSFYSVEDTAIAIGKFDGVHRGHRKIIEELFRKTADDMRTCIFTFDPSPETFLGIGDGRELTTAEEKRRIFQEIGIDLLVEFPFTEETASMPAETFVTEILVKKLHAQFICAGHDLSFGKDGKGNFALLQSLGKRKRQHVWENPIPSGTGSSTVSGWAAPSACRPSTSFPRPTRSCRPMASTFHRSSLTERSIRQSPI